MSLPSFPPSPDGEPHLDGNDDEDDDSQLFYDTPSPRSDADDEPLFDEAAMRRNTDFTLAEYGIEAAAEPHVGHVPDLPVDASNDVPQMTEAAANPIAGSQSGAIANPVANRVVPSNADFDIEDLHARLDAFQAENPSRIMEEAKDAPISPKSDDLNISLGSFDEERDLEPAIGPDRPTQASTSTADQTPAARPISVGPVYSVEASSGSVYGKPVVESAPKAALPIQASTSAPEPTPAAIPMSTDPVHELNASCGSVPEDPVQVPAIEADRLAEVAVSSADLVAAPAPTPMDPGLEHADRPNIFRKDSHLDSEDEDMGLDREAFPPRSPIGQTRAAAAAADQVSNEVETMLASRLANCHLKTEDDDMDVDPGFSDSVPADAMTDEDFNHMFSESFANMADLSNLDQTPHSASGGVFVPSPVFARVPSEDYAITPNRSLENHHQIVNEAAPNMDTEIENLKELHRQELQAYEAYCENWKADMTSKGFAEIAKREAQAHEEAKAVFDSEKAELENKLRAEFDITFAQSKQDHDDTLAEVREHAYNIQAEFAGLQTKIQDQQQMLASRDAMIEDKEAKIAKQKQELLDSADLLTRKDRIFEKSRAEYVKYSEEHVQSKAEADLVENHLRSTISRLKEEQKASGMEKKKAEIEDLKSTILKTSEAHQDLASIQEEIAAAKAELKQLEDQQAGLMKDVNNLESIVRVKEQRSISLEMKNSDLTASINKKNVSVKDIRKEAHEISKRYNMYSIAEAEEDERKDKARKDSAWKDSARKDSARKGGGKYGGKDNGKDGPALPSVAVTKEATTGAEKHLELGPILSNWFEDNADIIAEPMQPVDETVTEKKSVFQTPGFSWWIVALMLLAMMGGYFIATLAWREAPVVIDPWKVSVWSYRAGDGCGTGVPGWLWEEPLLELSGSVYG